jgi:CHASE3 domain sensor protein
MFKLHNLFRAAAFLMAGLACASLFADDLKIAIREPRSGEDLKEQAKLVKNQFNSTITNTRGFIVFDRANTGTIMDEHAQIRNSTLFSDDQARALGEFKGADFVIISELTLQDDGALQINVQALNIVTAQVVASANKLVETPSSKTIMEACQDMMTNLLNQMKKSVPADAPETMLGNLDGEIRRVLMNNRSNPKWNTNKNSYSLDIDFSGLTIDENRQFGTSRVSGRIYFTLTDAAGNGGGAELEIASFTEMGKTLIQRKIREQVQQKANIVIRDMLSELAPAN